MPFNVGTLDISSLLAVQHQSVAEFGLDTIQKILANDLVAHNTLVNQMVADFCDMTTERQRKWGTSINGEMVEVDEYGRAPGQRFAAGATGGFPLRLFQFPIGWTEKWMQTHTPADMATAVQGAEKAHLKRIQTELKRAMYLSSNYTFQDHLVDKVDLAVKRFVNADSMQIPEGPNGEAFDETTHTHYDANNGLAAANVKATIEDVIEHGHGAAVKVAINKTNETAVKALSGFEAYQDPRMILRVTDAPGKTLDISRLDNRAIGSFEGAEVWGKPWALASYALAWDASSPDKPLAYRQRTQTSLQGLRVAAVNSSYPLTAEFMEAEFGLAVWTRTNGAVLYFGGAQYTDPTL